jgi:radical SAM superfamily enzyme YgiQ (UPF0313 family)
MSYPIILTADRTLMSEYNKSMFLGFTACSPAFLPERLFMRLFCPPVPEDGGKVGFAPYGLRKIEASLLSDGFTEEDVIVAHPEHLETVIGDETEILGISTNDPLGLGPASTTFSDLIGKESYSSIFFRKFIKNPLIRKYNSKVIVGGPGAWQLENERIRAKLGIDCVLIGEGELSAPGLFKRCMNGDELPSFVQGEVVSTEKIPTIKNPTINGIVEIARGCGRGCKFCNPTMLRYRCQPIEKILEEAILNIRAGNGVLLHAEDVLRYNAKGFVPDEAEVIKLFEEVKKLTGRIGISHFALASVSCNPRLIESLSEILNLGSKEKPWISGQTGIESGSQNIVDRHMRGKIKPFSSDEWLEVVLGAHKILKENNWVPCSTLIMGLPGETPDDVIKTIELTEDLREYKSLIVPLFFVPIGILGEEKFFRAKDMLPEHWQLWAACLKHDFYWVYELAGEYLGMTGVGGWKARAIKILARFAERKLSPYIKMMGEGLNPIVEYGR